MKLRLSLCLSLAVAVLLLASCDSAQSVSPDETDNAFWPFEIGYSWTFHLDGGDDEDSTFTLEAADAAQDWYLLSDPEHRLVWSSLGDAILFTDQWPPSLGDESSINVYLQSPLVEGETWPLRLDGSGPDVELVKADYTYQTDHGDWEHCYKVSINSFWMVFSRGIGWVAEGYLNTEMTHLISYDFD